MALTPSSALEELLRDLFEVDDLRALLRRCDDGAALEASFPYGGVMAGALASHAVGVLRQCGEVEQTFSKALIHERPKRYPRIRGGRSMSAHGDT